MRKCLAGLMFATVAGLLLAITPKVEAAGGNHTYTVVTFNGNVRSVNGAAVGGVYVQMTFVWKQTGSPGLVTSVIGTYAHADGTYTCGATLLDWDGSPVGAVGIVQDVDWVDATDGKGAGTPPFPITMTPIVVWIPGQPG